MKARIFKQTLLLALVTVSAAGCVGFDLPHFFQEKPWTLLQGGDQLGRDQLANRYLVSQKIFPMNGLDANQVLTILGEPSEIDVVEHDVSEDWYYIYYKRYKTWPETPKGTFLVRFYQNKVIDVVNLK